MATKKHLFLFLLVILCSAQLDANTFSTQQVLNGIFVKEKKITLHNDSQKIGFITITTVFPGIHVLQSFYVYPAFRAKGYGKALLTHAIETARSYGGVRIYIQPGPFELESGAMKKMDDEKAEQEKIARLINLYRRVGFKPVATITRQLASLLYKLLHIDEDSGYLMVMEL